MARIPQPMASDFNFGISIVVKEQVKIYSERIDDIPVIVEWLKKLMMKGKHLLYLHVICIIVLPLDADKVQILCR